MNLIDTNIIAYAYDISEPIKRKKCLNLLEEVFDGKIDVFISNQVLAELFHTITKNFKKPYGNKEAKIIVSLFIKSRNWKKINYNNNTVEKAMELSEKFKISFWDALISATMIENNIFTIYTENKNSCNSWIN